MKWTTYDQGSHLYTLQIAFQLHCSFFILHWMCS